MQFLRQPAPSLDQVRLFLCDLDESLLGPDKVVGKRSREAIGRLREAGVTVALCTGRAPDAVRPIAADLSLRYMVCNNGATVHDGDTLLAEERMEADLTGALIRFFDQHTVPVYVMAPSGYFLTRRNEDTERADRARGVTPPLLGPEGWNRPAHKVMAYGGSHLYEACREAFGDQVHLIYHPRYLEIAPRGISKQWGGERLAAHLGVEAALVAAVGDAQNDIEMLRWAGVGAAMGNADPLLLEAADLVLPPHDQDGTAELFEAVLAAKGL